MVLVVGYDKATATLVSTRRSGPLPLVGMAEGLHGFVVDPGPAERDDQAAIALVDALAGDGLDAQRGAVGHNLTTRGVRPRRSRSCFGITRRHGLSMDGRI